MNDTIVIAGQSLFDVALQEAGHLGAVFQLAARSGKSITDQLTPGEQLTTEALATTDPDTLAYYKRHNIHPATDS